ncbi:MAG TPA: DJ-1/PfpI/YhbO family deglycase/protease [Kofleriaceae bacterium]|nr:DJ-1/PfpI/YhbO family deglycase/protease [Kofleriaceae bacterium]
MSKIAMLLDQMFDDAEFRVPYDRLRGAGHQVFLVGSVLGEPLIGLQRSEHVRVDASFHEVTARYFDALVIPGGLSPDHLRTDRDAVQLTREIALADKPVGAVGQGALLLIAADVVGGRLVISSPSLETALVDAGGRWFDRDVVVDGNIITARGPESLPAFADAFLHELDAGVPTRAEPVYPFAELG